MKRKLTKAQLNQKVLYFAYGSNLELSRITERLGEVTKVEVYNLEGYKLLFNCGKTRICYANIEEFKDSTVEGIIYEITYRQLLMLDWYEGFYSRTNTQYNGRKLHFYVGNYIQKSPVVFASYLDIILDACNSNKLYKSLADIVELGIHSNYRVYNDYEELKRRKINEGKC